MRRAVLVLCEDCPDRAACTTEDNICAVVRMVAETTAAQGLPAKVTDPEVLDRVATLLARSRSTTA